MFKKLKRHIERKGKFADLLVRVWFPFIHKLIQIYSTCKFLIKSKFYGIDYAGKAYVFGVVDIRRAAYSKITIGLNVSIISSSCRSSASSIFAPVKIQTLTETANIEIEENAG